MARTEVNESFVHAYLRTVRRGSVGLGVSGMPRPPPTTSESDRGLPLGRNPPGLPGACASTDPSKSGCTGPFMPVGGRPGKRRTES
jgi:hypothetical protein